MAPLERYQALVIGASLGGMQVIRSLLLALPADYALPVIVVQHVSDSSKGALADFLDRQCRIRVKEAEEKEPIRAATVYLAPANYHLLVERDRSFTLTVDERVNYARPAIDVLFETAADCYRAGLVGVLLTGANADGARGLQHIRERGGLAVVQDPLTAESPVMPRAGIHLAQPQQVLGPEGIERLLLSLARPSTPASLTAIRTLHP